MPVLGAMFVNLFGGLFTMLVGMFGLRLAVATAAVAAFTALTLALYGAMAILVGSLATAFPNGAAPALGVWLVVPDNGPLCLAAIFACDAACALYRWNLTGVRFAQG